MQGIDPCAYLQQMAAEMEETDRDRIEKALNDVEYLFEVIPPDMQEPAEKSSAC
jgi:hypothetical protein